MLLNAAEIVVGVRETSSFSHFAALTMGSSVAFNAAASKRLGGDGSKGLCGTECRRRYCEPSRIRARADREKMGTLEEAANLISAEREGLMAVSFRRETISNPS